MSPRAVFLLVIAAVACGQAPSQEQRARDVASWLTASSGVVTSWVGGSISANAADSNLESTARTIDDVSREGLPASMAARLQAAVGAVEKARAAIRAGDKTAAAAGAEEMARLSRELSGR